MADYENAESNSGFAVRKTDFLEQNGSKTYAFHWRTRSYGFSAEVENIWFYRDDILTFLKDAEDVLNQKQTKAVLEAMSDFELVLERVDDLGHFSVRFEVENPIHQNSASITTKFATQVVAEFLRDLERIIMD